jgi:hypothetical protein
VDDHQRYLRLGRWCMVVDHVAGSDSKGIRELEWRNNNMASGI